MRLSTYRPGRALLPVIVLACAFFSSAEPANSPEVLRKDVSEVRLTFYATDVHNRTVDSLQRNDLAVVDSDLIVRNFRSFSRSGATTLDLVVLVDSSESVLPQFKRELTEVLGLISQTTWIADDRITVISFSGEQPKKVCAGGCRQALAEGQLSALISEGATPLYDALQDAAKFLEHDRDPELRPVIILFSDGEDTISKSSGRDALESVLATDAQIYSVDIGDPRQHDRGAMTLRTLADMTGGRYLVAHEGAAKILEAVIDDLHSAYLLTYALPNHQDGYHPVRILPTRDLNLRFRSRSGYFYAAGDH